MPLYLKLFHGRSHPEEELDDWGADGPIFGPSPFFHTTYGWLVKFSEEGDDAVLYLSDDMLYYDGVWYGDWSIFGEDVDLGDLKARLTEFDPGKAVPTGPPGTMDSRVSWRVRSPHGKPDKEKETVP